MNARFIFVIVALATLVVPLAARADCSVDPAYVNPDTIPYAQKSFFHLMIGAGTAFPVTNPNLVATMEIGHRPFDGALSTGFSFSSTLDTTGVSTVLTPGIFARLDLVYLFLATKLWSCAPSEAWRREPIRIHLGARAGVDASQSYERITATPTDPYSVNNSYVLFRPELASYVDVEVLFDKKRHYGLLVRGTLDMPLSLDQALRWSVSVGFQYAFSVGDHAP